MLKTCVLGPVNGYFVALFTVPVGALGEQHLCAYKLFEAEPGDFLQPGHLKEGTTAQPQTSVSAAMDAGALLGVEEAEALPRGPAEMCAPDSPLGCLVYVSTASHNLTADELEKMVEGARARNQQYGITGFLLFVDQRFMQYLEGPLPHLELVYRRHIRTASTHHGLVDLMRERIAGRQYETWSLAFDTPDEYRWTRRELNPMLRELPHRSEVVEGLLSLFARQGAWPSAERR